MGQALQPQQSISHYQVVRRLGEGGMGEVYLARDRTLERDVALKVLPPELVGDAQRLQRFELEARSASSLNHPNIVTIYEIGQDDQVHFIAMEMVDGDTLGDRIHRDKTDVRTLLGYLAQAAEGLTKAHAAGIVHRDLKPGNIMVTKDGYTKILDFGLAKLTEPQTAGVAQTEVRTGMATEAGVVMGTAGYMSPEQILAKPVDARSDIFSFGCILYEAATGERPFAGDTNIETMHRVLNEKPRPIDELNQRVPAELRRLVRRCLAKNPDERYQSIKDVAIELREIVAEYDSLPVASSSSSSVSSAAIVPPAGRLRPRVVAALAVAAIAILVVAVAVAVFVSRRGGGPASMGNEPFQSMRMTTLATGNDISEAALSSDGRFLAYIRRDDARFSLHVRQVSTGSDVQAVSPQETTLRGLAFSPDGDYLYYLARDTPNYSSLFVVPSLGGTPRRRVTDVDTAVTFSPDGRRFCFLRGVVKNQQTLVVVADVASGTERVLATTTAPDSLPTNIWPRWSPDGRKIAAVLQRTRGGLQARPVVFDVETGRMERVGNWSCIAIDGLAWQSDNRLAVVGLDDLNASSQLWQITYPDGAARRITNDQNTYSSLTGAADTSLASVRTSYSSTGWSVPVAGNRDPRPLQLGAQNPLSIAAADDGTIVFADAATDRSALWTLAPDGATRRQITPDTIAVFGHTLLPGNAGTVFTAFGRDKVPHIWRASLDGADLVQVTRGGGESLTAVSPDGNRLLFVRPDAGTDVWTVAISGGEPTKAAAGAFADFSRDGKLMRVARTDVIDGRTASVFVLVPAQGGDPLGKFRPETRMRLFDWGGDSASLVYLVNENGVDTMMRWRIAGGSATPMFRFPEGRIVAISWLPDNRSLLFTALVGNAVNLWRWSPATAAPQQLTRFPIGSVHQFKCSPDGRTVYFNQRVTTRDVVLIRGIR